LFKLSKKEENTPRQVFLPEKILKSSWQLAVGSWQLAVGSWQLAKFLPTWILSVK